MAKYILTDCVLNVYIIIIQVYQVSFKFRDYNIIQFQRHSVGVFKIFSMENEFKIFETMDFSHVRKSITFKIKTVAL